MLLKYLYVLIIIKSKTINSFYLDTARHLRIFLGTLASCSLSGKDKSSLPCHKIFPVSASLRFIQLILKPFKISSALEGIFDEKWPLKRPQMNCQQSFNSLLLSTTCPYFQVQVQEKIMKKAKFRERYNLFFHFTSLQFLF